MQVGLLDAQFLELHAHGPDVVYPAMVRQDWRMSMESCGSEILVNSETEKKSSDGSREAPNSFNHHDVGPWSLDSSRTQRRAAL